MALSTGTRLGPYEIQSVLGTGGMGEVYRARDTRLERTVAIKVLAADLAGDGEFRQRFHAEARAISQLTHPHICTLYDIGEHEGTTYFVMELLEGETLAERLARGTAEQPALPLELALQIGIQIADALAAAHQRGIVHRDLKPGNVMLTKAHGGSSSVPHAKLLDFGLAKAAPVVMSSGLSMAATTPPVAVTAHGAILGTIQYMAPEQIEGGVVDTRSDIFAFGSVLYELLTGRKAFEGKSYPSVMAAILEREPPAVSALQPRVSAVVEATVKKCLSKNPDDRWQSAADLATALRWAVSGPLTTPQSAAPAVVPAARGRIARGLAMAVVVAATFAAGAFVASRYMSSRALPLETIVFNVMPPAHALFSPAPVASTAQLALSPDGRRVAFVAAPRRGVSQVWIKRLDSPVPQPVSGTEGASFPFWSPDNRFIGFFANSKLKKVDITGGAPQTLADAANGRGGAWGAGGEIVFTASPISPISRVSASGGAVAQETTLHTQEGATQHYWPQFLPDGRRFLFYQRSATPDHNGVYVKTLGASDATRVLIHSGMAVHTPGYLLYVHDGMLFAIAFDERQLQTRGEPVRVADRVGEWTPTFGNISVSASATGTIAHGPSVVMTTNLHWRNRSGAIVGTPTAPSVYRSPRLSPDQKSAALAVLGAGTQGSDIWLLELTRGGLSRMTAAPGPEWFPAWAPDGRRVYFASTRTGPSAVFQKAPGEDGEGQQVTETPISGQYPTDVTGDGEFVAIQETTAGGHGYDIAVVQPKQGKTARPLLASQFNEIQARFSPNGRWIAYASDESGRFEVYVRPFPTAGPQSPISVGGGTQPEWRRDGNELFFISADSKLMAVDIVTSGDTFTARVPRALFDVDIPEPSAPFQTDYAVSADGQRFLVNTVIDQPVVPSLTVILNWTAGLKHE